MSTKLRLVAGNVRLSEENLLDKDKIKNLSLMVRQLETRCEELQRHLDDIVLRRTGVVEDSVLRRQVYEDIVEDKTDVNCQVSCAKTKDQFFQLKKCKFDIHPNCSVMNWLSLIKTSNQQQMTKVLAERHDTCVRNKRQ